MEAIAYMNEKMPIPKDSKLRLPTYIVYYSTLALLITLMVLGYFIRSFPLSTDQLLVIALGVMGGYGVVEEIAKARKESVFGKHQSVAILSFLFILSIIVVLLLTICLYSAVTVILMVAVNIAFWGSLKLANWRSNKFVQNNSTLNTRSVLVSERYLFFNQR